MLAFTKIAAADLQKLYEIRNQQKKPLIEKVSEGKANYEFTFAHQAYFINLDDLKTTSLNESTRRSKLTEEIGSRIIETGDNKFQSIYDLHRNKGMQMFKDEEFLKDYETAFEMLAELKGSNVKYEVRTVRVPALNTDGLWLHSAENQTADKFIAVRAFSMLKKLKLYSWIDFLSQAKAAALKIDLSGAHRGG